MQKYARMTHALPILKSDTKLPSLTSKPSQAAERTKTVSLWARNLRISSATQLQKTLSRHARNYHSHSIIIISFFLSFFLSINKHRIQEQE